MIRFFQVIEVLELIRMEKVNIRRLISIVKIIAIVFCVSKSISITFLKEPKLLKTELLP